MKRRTHQILFRLDDKEYQSLLKKVEKSGLSREVFLRRMLAGFEIKERPSEDFFKIIKQLDQINNNMNQVAVKAHTLGFIDAPMYEENCERLDEIVAEILHRGT